MEFTVPIQRGEESVAPQEAGDADGIRPLQAKALPAPPDLPASGMLHPGLLHHRVRELAWHIPWYGFKTQARIALDSNVSPSTVSRLLRGQELPSLLVTLRLTEALSKRLGHPLEVREVFSLDGTYPRSVCELARCRGCQPPTSFDSSDNTLPDAPGMTKGQWVSPLPRKGGR